MKTSRFKTFADAIIAIIMTVLVLKIPQPSEASLAAIWELKTIYVSYLISFMIIFNIWYSNYKLFQIVKEINNLVVLLEGIILFLLSLIPYFTIWASIHIDSLVCETALGLIVIILNISYNLSLKAMLNHDKYNEVLIESVFNSKFSIMPSLVIIFGFLITYTIYVPGIYLCCSAVTFIWLIILRLNRNYKALEEKL